MAMAPLNALLSNFAAAPAPKKQPITIDCDWCAPKQEQKKPTICPACRERVLTQG